jgi:hypothetical protein
MPEEEGIIVYEGRLYAILVTGEIVNVCIVHGNNTNKIHEDEIISDVSSIYEVRYMDHLDISIDGHILFEDYGYYIAGWNNLFNTKPVLDQTIYPNKIPHRKILDINSYNITPSYNRDEYFDSVATIGIARDMNDPVNNMVGSYGTLDHTIKKITLNGKDMPFVVEIK